MGTSSPGCFRSLSKPRVVLSFLRNSRMCRTHPLLSSYKMILSGLPSPHFLTFWGASSASVVGGDLLMVLVRNATPPPGLTVSPPPQPQPSHQSEAGTLDCGPSYRYRTFSFWEPLIKSTLVSGTCQSKCCLPSILPYLSTDCI